MNRLGIRDQAALDAFEADATAQRALELLPAGAFGPAHYRATHRHLFGDVYAWAGKHRTVRIAKQDSIFCYPGHIPAEMDRLFRRLREQQFMRGLTGVAFAEQAAVFLADLNAIHPFREGNGRTRFAFIRLVAIQAGHRLSFQDTQPDRVIAAMVDSFHGRLEPLTTLLRESIGADRVTEPSDQDPGDAQP